MATGFDAPWPTFFLVAMLHFLHSGKHVATEVDSSWQLHLLVHGKYSAFHMATGFATPCHLHFFVTILHFFCTAITWQVELTQHGNCISCDMATTILLYGNSAQLHGNCSCPDVATVVAPHMLISPLFFYLHVTSYTLFPHNPSVS